MNRAQAIAEDKKWRAESDMRTLIEAAEIRKDPKRYKAAKEAALAKREELAAVVTQPATTGETK